LVTVVKRPVSRASLTTGRGQAEQEEEGMSPVEQEGETATAAEEVEEEVREVQAEAAVMATAMEAIASVVELHANEPQVCTSQPTVWVVLRVGH
jgi:cytochrome c556